MLHLGEIEERAETTALGSPEGCEIVEEVKSEVDKAANGGLTIDEDVVFRQVPATWAHKEFSGGLVVELIDPISVVVVESDGPIHSVLEVHLTPHQVLPARGQSIFKIRLHATCHSNIYIYTYTISISIYTFCTISIYYKLFHVRVDSPFYNDNVDSSP